MSNNSIELDSSSLFNSDATDLGVKPEKIKLKKITVSDIDMEKRKKSIDEGVKAENLQKSEKNEAGVKKEFAGNVDITPISDVSIDLTVQDGNGKNGSKNRNNIKKDKISYDKIDSEKSNNSSDMPEITAISDVSIDLSETQNNQDNQSQENQKQDGQRHHHNRNGDNFKRKFGNKNGSFVNYNNQGQYQTTEEDEKLPYPIDVEKTIIVGELRRKSIDELIDIAEKYNIEHCYKMLKKDVVTAILKECTLHEKLIYTSGVIEMLNDGSGFVRCPENNYVNTSEDAFIPVQSIRKFGLRFGDVVSCYIRPPRKAERYFSLQKLTEINGNPVDTKTRKINFDNLVPLYPKEKLNFETADISKSLSTRIIDLVSPIGKGQRALIVSPPKSGKTILMQNIAYAINQNHPEVDLIYLGIDERPEEFTEMQRTIKGEVVSSTFDEPASRHVALAEIIIEKAKRMVEHGRDVVILLDSITRLARAYNNALPSSGKILSGGVDSNALHRPKRFFGAARNIENGGSLTIIATALIETGSKMDEVIFEEFKGTGNSEIVLDRKFADKRIFPAIDVLKSGTRKEDEMIAGDLLSKMWMLRRIVDGMGSGSDALEFLVRKVKETKDNKEFFIKMNSPA